VRTLAAGGSLLDPGLVAMVLARLRRGGVEQDPSYAKLGPQERRILENYVSTLLHKLGFQSRTEAAVYATRRQDGSAQA
jgi:DNA-binding NarL/FixJ family response regulator